MRCHVTCESDRDDSTHVTFVTGNTLRSLSPQWTPLTGHLSHVTLVSSGLNGVSQS